MVEADTIGVEVVEIDVVVEEVVDVVEEEDV